MTCGARSDRRGAAAHVLCWTRRYLHPSSRAQLVDEVQRVTGLVGAERDRPEAIGAVRSYAAPPGGRDAAVPDRQSMASCDGPRPRTKVTGRRPQEPAPRYG